MTVYIKGKPMTPPIVGGITFALFDEARGIWSGSGTGPQELTLTPTGAAFMTQAEYDRFKADFDALALYDTAESGAETTANTTPTAVNAKAAHDVRSLKASVISSMPKVRNGKKNPFFT
jgi:hypothetical protein